MIKLRFFWVFDLKFTEIKYDFIIKDIFYYTKNIFFTL